MNLIIAPKYYRNKIRNPKLEIQKTAALKPAIQKSKSETTLFGILCFLIIWICFEFRISSFDFFLGS